MILLFLLPYHCTLPPNNANLSAICKTLGFLFQPQMILLSNQSQTIENLKKNHHTETHSLFSSLLDISHLSSQANIYPHFT